MESLTLNDFNMEFSEMLKAICGKLECYRKDELKHNGASPECYRFNVNANYSRFSGRNWEFFFLAKTYYTLWKNLEWKDKIWMFCRMFFLLLGNEKLKPHNIRATWEWYVQSDRIFNAGNSIKKLYFRWRFHCILCLPFGNDYYFCYVSNAHLFR